MSKTLTPEEQNEQANWCAALAEAAKLPLEDRISSPLRILSDRLPGIFAALRAEREETRKLRSQQEDGRDSVEYIREDGRRFAWSESNCQYQEVPENGASFTLLRKRLAQVEKEREADRRLLERCRRKLKLITSGSPLLRDLDARLGETQRVKHDPACRSGKGSAFLQDCTCDDQDPVPTTRGF